MRDDLDALVQKAAAGDREALELVLREIRTPVYALAFRMLGMRADAEDAAQEILLRVARSIASFRGESKFTTWIYRIAANYLLTTRKRGSELKEKTLEHMAQWIDAGVAANHAPSQDPVLVDEAKLVCAQAMLSCLDREHRLAFVLGEIVDVSSEEGAAILDISSDLYRQRLSRARRDLDAFLRGRCGLTSDQHPCTCAKQVPHGIAGGIIDPIRLRFADHPARIQTTQITQLVSAAQLYRSLPRWEAPAEFAREIRTLLETVA